MPANQYNKFRLKVHVFVTNAVWIPSLRSRMTVSWTVREAKVFSRMTVVSRLYVSKKRVRRFRHYGRNDKIKKVQSWQYN